MGVVKTSTSMSGGKRKKGFIDLSHTKNTAIKIDGKQQQHATCFLVLARGNVRQTSRHCHPLSIFAPYQLIEMLQLPIFFQMVEKNSHTVYLTFIGSSANLLVTQFCLASSEKCDLPILAFFTAIGREFHIFCHCDQICLTKKKSVIPVKWLSVIISYFQDFQRLYSLPFPSSYLFFLVCDCSKWYRDWFYTHSEHKHNVLIMLL